MSELPKSLCPICEPIIETVEKSPFIEAEPSVMPKIEEDFLPRYRSWFDDIVYNRWCTDNPPPDLSVLVDPTYEDYVWQLQCPAYPEFSMTMQTGSVMQWFLDTEKFIEADAWTSMTMLFDLEIEPV